MNLQETRIEIRTNVDELFLKHIIPLFHVLNIDPHDFSKTVDLIGLEKFYNNIDWYKRLIEAEKLLSAREDEIAWRDIQNEREEAKTRMQDEIRWHKEKIASLEKEIQECNKTIARAEKILKESTEVIKKYF